MDNNILVMTFDENEVKLDSSNFDMEAGNVNQPQIVIGSKDGVGLRSHKLHLVATQPTFDQTALDGLSANTFISYSLENRPSENIRLQIISSQ